MEVAWNWYYYRYCDNPMFHLWKLNLRMPLRLAWRWKLKPGLSDSSPWLRWRRVKEIGKEPWLKFLCWPNQETVLFTASSQHSCPCRGHRKSLGKGNDSSNQPATSISTNKGRLELPSTPWKSSRNTEVRSWGGGNNSKDTCYGVTWTKFETQLCHLTAVWF